MIYYIFKTNSCRLYIINWLCYKISPDLPGDPVVLFLLVSESIVFQRVPCKKVILMLVLPGLAIVRLHEIQFTTAPPRRAATTWLIKCNSSHLAVSALSERELQASEQQAFR